MNISEAMALALVAAGRARASTSPNPWVGQQLVLAHLTYLEWQRAEGVKRADGAAKGRQMQAIPGH